MHDHHSDEAKLLTNKFLILWPKWKSKKSLHEKVASRINEMLYQEGGVEEIIKIFSLLDG